MTSPTRHGVTVLRIDNSPTPAEAPPLVLEAQTSAPTEQLPSSSADFNGTRTEEYTDEESSSSEEDDPLVREYLERQDIVEKYHKGTEGQEVDPWENPDFEIYKITDTFGFMHESDFDPNINVAERMERVKKERKRDTKWLRMLDDWDRSLRGTKLRNRVWKGVPNKLRTAVWTELLQVKEARIKYQGVYEGLLKRAELLSKDLKQIDLDINRTYRDHLFFRKRYDIKQRSLFNVLAAYSMWNVEVGYCQGMSQIVALLLMYMDEQDAFWALQHLMCRPPLHSMHGFFLPGFPKLMRFQTELEKIVGKYLPRLKRHMDKMQIPAIYTTKWFFGCFLDRVPFSLALRLWDVFILEGDAILLAMAYNIMKMHMKTLKKLNMEQTMTFLQDALGKDFGFPDDLVMESLHDCLKKLRSDRLDGSRLDANAPNEEPTRQFGMVLRRKLNEIETEVFEITSRASRNRSRHTSRTCMDNSVPATPRSKQRSKENFDDMEPVSEMAVLQPSRHDRSRLPPIGGGRTASPPSPAPPSAPAAMINTPRGRDTVHSSSSFYDNVAPDDWADGGKFESTEERRSFERYSGGDGSTSAMLTSQLSTTVTQIETHTTTTLSNAAAGRDRDVARNRSPPSAIVRGDDHVTYIKLDPSAYPRPHPYPFRGTAYELTPSGRHAWSGSSKQTPV